MASPSSTNEFDSRLFAERDDFCHSLGDVVQVAGEDGDVTVEAVDLDAGTIELPFDGGRCMEFVWNRCAGRGKHRLNRGEHLKPDRLQARDAVTGRYFGNLTEITSQHRGPPDQRSAGIQRQAPLLRRPRRSSAPCRTSPVITWRRNACSVAVARPISLSRRSLLSFCEPGPIACCSAVSVSSTSLTVSVG